MQLSTDQILTTHTGSLPRPPDLTEMLQRRDRGEAVDGLDERIAAGVTEIVGRQVKAGVAVVNDGEASKIGYATYVKERLNGFGGSGGMAGAPSDMLEFPGFMERVMAGLDFEMPACIGPVSSRGLDPVQADIANLQAAIKGAAAAEAFMTAASPGVIAVFLANQHYPTHEEYIWALAEAMKPEYDAIHDAGLLLQVDCPDLAMARHIGDLGLKAPVHIEALNHATRDIPPERMRLHLCWGNYEGPHHHDVPLAEIIELVLTARPAAISFEGANPRHEHEWRVFEDVELPDGKVLIPGVIDSTTNYIEHPQLVADRIVRYAKLVGRENVIAGSDCGFATFASYLKVDPGITWAKLRALSDGARLATEELFAHAPA
ncbi:MAG: cobalamin-independent methionine synthase II family protein [Solirubrobacteraceae bacterium]